MQEQIITVKSFGKVFPKNGNNTRSLYEHQRRAMENLNVIIAIQ